MKNKNEKLLLFLQSAKSLIDSGDDVNFNKAYEFYSLNRNTQSIMKKLGIIAKIGKNKFEWIGGVPNDEMCNVIKDYHKQLSQTEHQEEKPEFEVQTIDEKLNHINFMLDQLFDRVNYMFESLSDDSIKVKVSSDWFKRK